MLTKLVEWYRFGVGDEKSFFVIFCFVVKKNYWPVCETLEKNCARARSTPPKLEQPARKVGGEAAHFWWPFLSSFGGVERVFLEVFARWPSILSDDNNRQSRGWGALKKVSFSGGGSCAAGSLLV